MEVKKTCYRVVLNTLRLISYSGTILQNNSLVKTSVTLIGKIDGYLCKAIRWGYNGNLKMLSEILHDVDMNLFRSMLRSTHRIHQLLSPLKFMPMKLCTSHCTFALPYCHYNLLQTFICFTMYF